jgi:hypothetical protein
LTPKGKDKINRRKCCSAKFDLGKVGALLLLNELRPSGLFSKKINQSLRLNKFHVQMFSFALVKTQSLLFGSYSAQTKKHDI